MTAYCNCKAPEPEEVEPGQVYCMKCELEILRSDDPPEPDEDNSDEYRENQEIEQREQLERQFEANTYPHD